MPSNTEETFRRQVQEHLPRLRPELTGVLRQLIGHQYPPEVVLLSFEIFHESFTSGFPVRVFFMDDTNSEYFIEKDGVLTYPSPVDPGLLEVNHVYPQEIEDAAFDADPNLPIWEIAAEEFIPWFADCWNRAGGASFPLMATISEHDANREFNLMAGEWQQLHASFEQ